MAIYGGVTLLPSVIFSKLPRRRKFPNGTRIFCLRKIYCQPSRFLL